MTFDELLASFKIQPTLNRQFWQNGKLNPAIRKALLRIAKVFYDSIDLKKKPKIKDIVFMGSLANYNYSSYSDVDIHLFLDFGNDREMMSQFFLLAKSKWNDKHDVTIKGYDVEVYAADYREPYTATGVYSILNDTWVKKPKRQLPVVDAQAVRNKVVHFIGEYNELIRQFHKGQLDGLDVKVKKFRAKLAKFRQSGLESGGEYSTENLAFKVLRRMNYLEKAGDLQNIIVDKQLSVKEAEI